MGEKAFVAAVMAGLVLASASAGGAEPGPYDWPHPPKVQPALRFLPPGAVRPEGWLRDWSITMRDGYTSRMEDVALAFRQAWAADYKMTGPKLFWPAGGWPYEGGGYWFDGLVGMGQMLEDDNLIKLTQRRLDPVVANMRPESILFFWWLDRNNPDDCKACVNCTVEWPMWASGLMGRVLVKQYAATRDPRVLKALEMAYAGKHDWINRGWSASNPWPALATYGWTGNEEIRQSLTDFFNGPGNSGEGHPWAQYRQAPGPAKVGVLGDHGVHFLESTTPWALGYLWTGHREFLDAALQWQALAERYAMMPYGVIVSDEGMGPASPVRSTETCDVAGTLWAKNMLLWITGESSLADQVEQAFFNAAPAVVSRDCRRHVYLQMINRMPGWYRSWGRTNYSPVHGPLCCTASLNRILPEYVGNMWFASADRGLVASCYGPCTVLALVGNRVNVRIQSRTDYPFNDTIAMTVEPEQSVAFPLSLRVPGWCTSPRISVNGQAGEAKPDPRGFVRLSRTWSKGDRIEVQFPMTAKVIVGPQGYGSVHYGPLLFAVPVPEVDDNTGAPGARTNAFALASDVLKVERRAMPAKWDWPADAPLRITASVVAFDWSPKPPATATASAPAKKKKIQIPPPPPAAVSATASVEAVTLVPYGCTKLRYAMFSMPEGPAPQK